jgi:Domain of Unknown Function (DUF1080)
MGVACLAAACGGGSGADRPNGRPDSGTASDGGADGGPSDGGILGEIGPLGETSWTALLDDSLSRFYRWMPSRGRDNDPEGIFAMDGGTLHVLGLPATDEEQDFGYVATLADIGNYRARVEQKWGTNTFAPRMNQLRDSGLLYHLSGADQIWPQSIEFQIMEYNLGDLWMLAGTGVFAPVDDPSSSAPIFDPLGTLTEYRNGRIVKSSDSELLTDWNALELIASGRDSAQIVNGRWVNGGSNLEADQGAGWAGLNHGHLALQAEGAEVFYRSLEVRPLAYLAPPPDAVVLFDGSNADAWIGPDGGAQGWIVDGGVLQVVPFAGDLRTQETYGDVRLHLEFQVPATPTSEAHEDRGNSGVYLQGRYEVQILDSFGLDAGPVDCGAVYGVSPPAVNESFPPGIWQSYDIVFRAPTWDGGTKETPARMTVVWNGSVVQQETEVPGPTRLGDPEAPGPGPIRLQDHWNKVRYRNIWLQPLPPEAFDAGVDGGTDGGTGGGDAGADGG